MGPSSGAQVLLCDGCRKLAYCRFGVKKESLDASGIAHFDVECPSQHEAGPRTAHGGWTAAVLEELLGRVVYLNGILTVAGELSIRYERPVPVGIPLTGRSWVVERKPRKWHLAGELILPSSGAILARATGISVLVDANAHYARFEQWLTDQKARPAT